MFQVCSHVTQKLGQIKNLLHTKVRYCSVVSESVVICQLSLKMLELTYDIHIPGGKLALHYILPQLQLPYQP